MTVELRPHQQKAVDELSNGKILWGGVGSGKTITALVYFYTKVCGGVIGDLSSIRKPRDLYVITTAKKRDSLDWQNDAAKLAITGEADSSVDGITITVDSWNNIGKYEGVKDAFFVFDEQRLVGSGAWTKSFYKIAKFNQWILLSATPGDTWLDYIPVFVANGFYPNRTAFKRQHVVYSTYTKFPKVERYVEVGKLVRLRNSILVEMPYERHTTRNLHHVEVDYDRELFEKVVKKRWHVYEDRPLRDVAELFVVMRKVVNSDSSRLKELSGLLQEHPKVIVFYNFDYELEILRTLAVDSTQRSMPLQDSEKSVRESIGTPVMANDASIRDLKEKLDSTKHVRTTATSRLWDERPLDDLRNETTSISSPGSPTSTDANTDTLPTTGSSTSSSDSFAVAEWNGHKHEPIPQTDRWVYLVQYQAGAEGWNCIDTDAIVFYSLTYSYKLFEQAQGRIDRLNTPFSQLHYYILRSKSMIDLAIWRALREKRNFNERQYGLEIGRAA